MSKNYLTYPCKYMNISQNYNSTFSHSIHTGGTPVDYPIDEPCKDSGRDWLYCPCDEVEVKRIYGVQNGGTNTLWIESTTPVDMPCGRDYITILIMHPEDDDLRLLHVGQKFKRGEAICREGADGMATGNHFHLSFGKGHIKGNGWVTNSKKAWVLSTDGENIKPEYACYLDTNFTTVIQTQGLNFQYLPSNENGEDTAMIGIDVSKHNGAISWSSMYKNDISFVIARAGFGSNENQIDIRFYENIDGALKKGLHVGAYWFSYALNIDDVKAEAALFAKVLERYKGKMDFPVFYDLEYDGFNYAEKYGVTITKEMATEFALTFIKEMNKYGWFCGNYTNLDCYKRYFDSEKMKDVDIFYADWRNILKPEIPCTIWQYSNTGAVSGIIGNVDMDICYKDYSKFIKENGWNGFEIYVEEEPELPTQDIQSLLDEITLLKVTNKLLEEENEKYRTIIQNIKNEISDIK